MNHGSIPRNKKEHLHLLNNNIMLVVKLFSMRKCPSPSKKATDSGRKRKKDNGREN